MKVIKPITRNESVITCDWCGTEVRYTRQYCYSCRRYACDTCFHEHMTFSDTKTTAFYGYNGGCGQPQVQSIYFCKNCDAKPDKLNMALREIRAELAAHHEMCQRFQEKHRKQCEAANRKIDAIQEAMEREPTEAVMK